MLKRLLRLALVLSILLAIAAAAAGWWAWQRIQQPYGSTRSQVVEIENGQSATAILERLASEGLIVDSLLARLYLVYVLDDPPLRAGEYAFTAPASLPDVLDKLVRGDVVTYPAKVLEGLTLEETAEALAQAGFANLEALLGEMRDPGRIADLDPEATTLEGYLFPDTYHFARGASAALIVDTMVRTFRERLAAVDGPRPGLGRGNDPVSLRGLVTLASIIEKEALLDDERPTIAGVYANRLRNGIALYADPTVIFAIKLRGDWDGNLRKQDLKYDSPYNTYVHPGLPPGPICSPGRASLEAALGPADVPYFYFVSRNDGSHVFASSLSEHNRNVEIWQKRYWRQRWAKERGGS